MNRIKAAGRAAGRFLKDNGECLAWAAVCILILGWSQQNDEYSNARFAKDSHGTAYAAK